MRKRGLCCRPGSVCRVRELKTSVQNQICSRLLVFWKFNRNKIARLKTCVQEPNHETCLVLIIMHITKLQQTIATSQHIWLLTSKLIKKAAYMTTHTIFCQLQKHDTFHLSKNRYIICLFW